MDEAPLYPRTSVQLAILVCGCLLCTGITFTWVGLWSIETFLLSPPCLPGSNESIPKGCCRSCLGIDTFEYGLYFTIPSICSTGVVFYAGVCIDSYGLPFSATFFTFFGIIGASLRAVSGHLAHVHGWCVFFFIFGEIFVEAAHFGFLSMRETIANRFFTPRFRGLALALQFGVTNMASILASFWLPHVAKTTTVAAALWLSVGANLVTIVPVLGLAAIFKVAPEMAVIEDRVYMKETGASGQRKRISPKTVAESACTFRKEYWLICFAFGLWNGAEMTMLSNFSLFQYVLYGLSRVQTGINVAYGWCLHSAVPIVIGVVLSVAALQMEIAVVGCLLGITAGFLLILPNGSALGAVLLWETAYPFAFCSLKSSYASYVPAENIGIASALIVIVAMLFTSVYNPAVGLIMWLKDQKLGARISGIMLMAAIGVSLVLTITLIVIEFRKRLGFKQDDEERRLTNVLKSTVKSYASNDIVERSKTQTFEHEEIGKDSN